MTKVTHQCSALTPDWIGKCHVCGASPIVPITDMCGPCTFGESETLNGNWEDHMEGEEKYCEYCSFCGDDCDICNGE